TCSASRSRGIARSSRRSRASGSATRASSDGGAAAGRCYAESVARVGRRISFVIVALGWAAAVLLACSTSPSGGGIVFDASGGGGRRDTGGGGGGDDGGGVGPGDDGGGPNDSGPSGDAASSCVVLIEADASAWTLN